jgi:hypothetical protein
MRAATSRLPLKECSSIWSEHRSPKPGVGGSSPSTPASGRKTERSIERGRREAAFASRDLPGRVTFGTQAFAAKLSSGVPPPGNLDPMKIVAAMEGRALLSGDAVGSLDEENSHAARVRRARPGAPHHPPWSHGVCSRRGGACPDRRRIVPRPRTLIHCERPLAATR